ncbi:DMT family transporter [Gorillibacterium massiliense]|uniref:DMT family transporter n=1 Tax=Gorillibacterium massiliense TaxID=1280390 RepID=UPI0004B21759|nr:DMT family transporter [Gorillibacterium massiliense]
MKGWLFALFGGLFITLQGVANTEISNGIGTWQAAALTQFTGFVTAILVSLFMRDGKWQAMKQVKPLYWIGGAFGAIVIFSNVTAIRQAGVTLTVSVLMIAQLLVAFVADRWGWFGLEKQKMRLPQFAGIGLMIAGVVILGG